MLFIGYANNSESGDFAIDDVSLETCSDIDGGCASEYGGSLSCINFLLVWFFLLPYLELSFYKPVQPLHNFKLLQARRIIQLGVFLP